MSKHLLSKIKVMLTFVFCMSLFQGYAWEESKRGFPDNRTGEKNLPAVRVTGSGGESLPGVNVEYKFFNTKNN